MHFSMIAACLVLFVAISDISAQHGFRVSGGLRPVGGLGGAIQDECYCNNEDYCVRRNSRLMCQSVTGQFYAPISRLGQVGLGHRVHVNQPMIKQVVHVNPMVGQVRVSQPIVRHSIVNQVNQGLASCCQRSDYQVCAVQDFPNFLNMNRNVNMIRNNVNSYIQGGICNKYYFNGQSCQPITVYTTCVAQFNPRNLFESIQLCQAKCAGGY